MSLIVQYSNRLLQLTRRFESSPTSSPDRWLIDLRWVAIAGMLATVVGAKLVAPALQLAPLLFILGALVFVNVAWLALVGRARSKRPLRRGATVGPQIAVDLVILALLLWHSGGLRNPFAPFLTFQVVLAGLLASSRMTLLVTALTVAVAAALHVAPPLPLGDAADTERVQVVGRLVAVVALGLFLGFFVWLYARRLERLHDDSARNEKLAALGRTLAAMCHELNTPLGSIVIAGKDLEQLGAAAGSTEIEDLARTVTRSATRASDIISLLRGAVKPSAQRERVELAGFVAQAARQELDRLGFAGERVIFAPVPVEVPVLPTALGQIVTNLIKNAVDAARGVPTPRIEVSVLPREDGVDVCIADNGRGVSPGIVPRLGEPFQSTKAEGMGLGLYVSSLLAERMGARLALDSAAGEGARLTLSFDLEQASQPLEQAR